MHSYKKDGAAWRRGHRGVGSGPAADRRALLEGTGRTGEVP